MQNYFPHHPSFPFLTKYEGNILNYFREKERRGIRPSQQRMSEEKEKKKFFCRNPAEDERHHNRPLLSERKRESG